MRVIVSRTPFLLMLVLSHFSFAGELVIDSKPKVDFARFQTEEAWQFWRYNPQEKDYNGKFAPHGYVLQNGKGYRRGSGVQPANIITTIVIKGQKIRDSIQFQEKDVYRSRLNLNDIRSFFLSITTLEGAFYEREKIFLIGRKQKGLEPAPLLAEDVIVAIRAVFNTRFRGAAAGIFAPVNPFDTQKYHDVRFKGLLSNTHIGQVLFESDRLLKSLSLGIDNISKEPFPFVAEWKNDKFSYIKKGKSSRREEWHRFLFLVENMKLHADNESDVLRFEDEKIIVRTQRVKTEKGVRENYFEKGARTPESRFTEDFTKNFAYYRKQFRVLDEMVQVAKLMAVVKWLYENGIVIKLGKERIKGFYSRYTPPKTPVIKVTKTRTYKRIDMRRYEVTEMEMGSVGGVDLQNFRYTKKRLSRVKESMKKDPKYVVFRIL